ncbi:universal stress protein [Rhodococcus sp. OK302]|uniref:universal stress protein n=1 Tax=Rhodococcus sp. OK302 TaxID=1882769 RepID=UPI000B942453|nr:universal stress protein [Rhodococcus sp. OK302]OYD68215.1 nucleotide-binding universal stress UspA family protein [Rhodococcus sp. OK302]
MTTLAGHQDIVVGIDGSEASTAAARWAGSIAQAVNARLILAHALPQEGPIYSPAAVMLQSQFLNQIREDGEAITGVVTDLLADEFPSLVIESEIAPGPPMTHILECAETARLIVMGSTGSGALRSRLLGSTALKVANHAPCPVTVWRGTAQHPGPDQRPVVVGVDGSTLSEKAVEYAFQYADQFEAPLFAVHTWQGASTFREGGAGILIDWEAVEQEESALLAENLAGMSDQYPDVAVTRISEPGAAAPVMLKYADDAQLLVVGSHGRSAMAGAVMGSTSQNLLHHAPCPVMIARG